MSELDKVIYTVRVYQDGAEFYASWKSGDQLNAGCGPYAPTPLEALAAIVGEMVLSESDIREERERQRHE
jgi:hypothetical protein